MLSVLIGIIPYMGINRGIPYTPPPSNATVPRKGRVDTDYIIINKINTCHVKCRSSDDTSSDNIQVSN